MRRQLFCSEGSQFGTRTKILPQKKQIKPPSTLFFPPYLVDDQNQSNNLKRMKKESALNNHQQQKEPPSDDNKNKGIPKKHNFKTTPNQQARNSFHQLYKFQFSQEIKKKFPITDFSLEDFKILDMIGSGAYGKVYLVQHIEQQVLYALKVINLVKAVQRQSIVQIKRQIQIGTRVTQNDHLLPIQGFFIEKGSIFLLLEFCESGSFYDFIYKRPDHKTVKESDARQITAQLVDAVTFLHRKLIMHRDIKPQNILLKYRNKANQAQSKPKCNEQNKKLFKLAMAQLEEEQLERLRKQGQYNNRNSRPNSMKKILSCVISKLKCKIFPNIDKIPSPKEGIYHPAFEQDQKLMLEFLKCQLQKQGYPNNLQPFRSHSLNSFRNYQIKLTDFGCSAHTHRGNRKSFCGTVYYMAPEVFLKSMYSFQVDVWAIGVLAYQMLQGDLPFLGRNTDEIIKRITNHKWEKFNYPMSGDAISFIRQILVPEQVVNRPNVQALLSHKWIKGLTVDYLKKYQEMERKRAIKFKRYLQEEKQKKRQENEAILNKLIMNQVEIEVISQNAIGGQQFSSKNDLVEVKKDNSNDINEKSIVQDNSQKLIEQKEIDLPNKLILDENKPNNNIQHLKFDKIQFNQSNEAKLKRKQESKKSSKRGRASSISHIQEQLTINLKQQVMFQQNLQRVKRERKKSPLQKLIKQNPKKKNFTPCFKQANVAQMQKKEQGKFKTPALKKQIVVPNSRSKSPNLSKKQIWRY